MKKAAALVGAILGTLTLSLELFLLHLVQKTEVTAYSETFRSVNIVTELPCKAAFLITTMVIIVALVLYFTSKEGG